MVGSSSSNEISSIGCKRIGPGIMVRARAGRSSACRLNVERCRSLLVCTRRQSATSRGVPQELINIVLAAITLEEYRIHWFVELLAAMIRVPDFEAENLVVHTVIISLMMICISLGAHQSRVCVTGIKMNSIKCLCCLLLLLLHTVAWEELKFSILVVVKDLFARAATSPPAKPPRPSPKPALTASRSASAKMV